MGWGMHPVSCLSRGAAWPTPVVGKAWRWHWVRLPAFVWPRVCLGRLHPPTQLPGARGGLPPGGAWNQWVRGWEVELVCPGPSTN